MCLPTFARDVSYVTVDSGKKKKEKKKLLSKFIEDAFRYSRYVAV